MPTPKRILLAEPDPMLRASLAEQLADEFDVTQAGGEFAGLAAGHDFVVLGFGPDPALVRQLRAEAPGIPIILLSADAAEAEAGLAAGASDTIARPFRLATLLARLHAHLRSHGQDDEAGFTIGPYRFHPHSKSLTGPRKNIRLTEKETNILLFLQRTGGTVARETLLHEVWGYNRAVTTHTLETHIYRLRRKIGPEILITEEGGYRLAAEPNHLFNAR